MSKKNLIELCLSPDLGGLELYMARCAKALKGDFNITSVISSSSKLGEYFDDTDSYVRLEKSLNIFTLAKRLARVIDSCSADIIHLHWTKDIPTVVLATLFSKCKPKLVQTRNMTMTRFKSDFYHKALYGRMDLILGVTKQVKEQLERYIPEDVRPKIEVLYMGTDAPEALSSSEIYDFRDNIGYKESDFVVGMVGRISQEKGPHLLIEAISQIDGRSVQACFVGHEMIDGYIDELKRLAAKIGVADRVSFLGFIKEPDIFFSASDCVVLASKKETFGLVLIESMRANTAVVGSNSGGVVEIIEDEVSGLLFSVGDYKSLASKIVRLKENQQLKESLEINAMERCKELFDNKKQFEKLSRRLQCL